MKKVTKGAATIKVRPLMPYLRYIICRYDLFDLYSNSIYQVTRKHEKVLKEYDRYHVSAQAPPKSVLVLILRFHMPIQKTVPTTTLLDIDNNVFRVQEQSIL